MESVNTSLKVSEIELSYKSKVKPSELPKLSSSRDTYEILKSNWDQSKIDFVEQFHVLVLNRANKVLGIYLASTGITCGTVVDAKAIFVVALKTNASAVIIAHNHPSGNLNPSQQDIELTKQMSTAGKFLGIPVLDHIILTSESYYSFADEGRL